ncbi:MAG: YfhO family protein [bacterium]|nr:YfhO family protein [bacterium]
MRKLIRFKKAVFASLFFLAFLLLACLYFWRNLTPKLEDLVYLNSDFLASFFPSYLTAISRIKSGAFLPLWDPTQYMGMPFLASIHVAFFYPFHLVLFFISAGLNLSWSQIYSLALVNILIHVALGGYFTFLFAQRVLKVGRFEGFFAGVIFAFSGVVIASVNTVGVLEAIIWLPLLLLLLDNLLEKLSLSSAIWLGVVFAISILAGYPYSIIYDLVFLGAFFSYRLWGMADKRKALQSGKLAFLGLALGVGLCGVQLLPSLELMRESYRSGLSFEGTAFSVNLEPASLVDYFFPLYYLRLGKNFAARFPGFTNYVGVASLILVIFSLLDRKNRRAVLFFFGLGVLSLFISMGGNTFLHSLFYLLVPFYSKLRTMAIASYLTSLCLAALAALGLRFLLEDEAESDESKKKLWRWLIFMLAAPLCLGLVYYLQTHKYKADALGFETLIQETEMLNLFLLYASLTLVLLFFRFRRVSRPVFKTGLLLLLVVDLFSIGRFFSANNSKTPPASFYNQDNEVVKFLQERQKVEGPFRVDLRDLSFHYNTSPLKLDQVGGYQALAPKKISSVFIPYLEQLPFDSNLRRLANVRYFISFTQLEKVSPVTKLLGTVNLTDANRNKYWVQSEAGWINPQAGSHIYIYALNSLPRFFFSEKVTTGAEENLLALLAQTTDLRTVAVKNGEIPLEALAFLNQPTKPEAKQSIKINLYRPEKVELETLVDQTRILVFGDNFFPGWKVFVDDQENKVLNVNYFMKGVILSPGMHKVVFSYQPASFSLGATLSLISLLAIAGLLVYERKKIGPKGTYGR